MTAEVVDLDADRRHFAEFLATRVLDYVQHRYNVWPFAGEDKEDLYRWARTDQNRKFRALETPAILRHLTGIKTSRGVYSGIGVPALADLGWAGLGVLDIDTHASGIVVDCAPIAAVCDPALLVTRSSSGRGVHIYAFPPAGVPINSHVLRLALDRYVAYLLGQGVLPANGIQIDTFPKGHGVEKPEPADRIQPGGSVRFPFAGGRRVNFTNYPETWDAPDEHPGELFWGGGWVTNVKEIQRIITLAQDTHLSWLATWAGPPCLGTILTVGGDEGERNVLIFDAAYFAAFATHDEATTAAWVQEHIVPQLRGSTIASREIERTVRSGIESALDPSKPQYVCTTSICDKNEGRCVRLGQPTASGHVAGTVATAAAVAGQQQATVGIITASGPNALSVRDGILYIGDTATRIEYCPIEERYYVHIAPYMHRFTPTGIVTSTAIPVLASLLQRDVMLPKGSQRGWLTKFLLYARQVATTYHHPAYSQLKTALYTITQTEGEAVTLPAIGEAVPAHRGYSLDAAVRHYPDTDWRPVISPDNKVLGMRLVACDLEFVTIIPPPPAAATPPESHDPTDY